MEIHLLSEETINRIAAGEVVERPVNVVKELVENSIDAGATAITVEIREGGKKMIRVTDNGCGIEKSQITKAFERHATSKIRDDSDLTRLVSLGFRGEALSSIAAVAQVEMITKTRESLTGIRATNQPLSGFSENERIKLDLEEIGAPDGTSVVVRNLFYNVPVRARFLKQPQTEAGYITDLVERQALSHPSISFHYRVDGREKLHTTGNGDLKELLYRIYGREISKKVLPVKVADGHYSLEGFIGRPEISRSTRNFEIFFVNGRMLRSNTLSRAVEAGYRTDLMQHKFPFAVLHLGIPTEEADVNVHPTKMEVRFSEAEAVFRFIDESVHGVLHGAELIPAEILETQAQERARKREEAEEARRRLESAPHPEPFERARFVSEPMASYGSAAAGTETASGSVHASGSSLEILFTDAEPVSPKGPARVETEDFLFEDKRIGDKRIPAPGSDKESAGSKEREQEVPLSQTPAFSQPETKKGSYQQASLFERTDFSAPKEEKMLVEDNRPKFRIIGQVFETYWLIQYEGKLLVVDQHAAHEKVNYERLMKRLENNDPSSSGSQMLAPAAVITLTGREEGELHTHEAVFKSMGYEIEPLGGSTYAIRAVPMELYGNDATELLRDTLEEMVEEKMTGTPSAILAKIASMSCKAAVKGNSLLSEKEAQVLIDELLKLDNPYHCPHGRPTMIVFSQSDMDKKFKRIVT
ncbi:MAG: DNA mismatch repair endonuclease MutL [Lachnospiraceae bacterium]|nr:DNA mismatch repair endonuclease MutL [Lachnospiraceae bacterium]